MREESFHLLPEAGGRDGRRLQSSLYAAQLMTSFNHGGMRSQLITNLGVLAVTTGEIRA